ncbi:MFS transporter [Bacillus sp. FJAT-42315]|uniref:MFS transporter n=1 Tax=Bacillus sp. FJAT-42315 TaxID=2014077 RepID=UPI000C23FC86|nr:MFS transporter [Bacillus sp. FJAT-42315]
METIGMEQKNPATYLPKSTKVFLLILCLSGIATSLSTIFINVFLYKVSLDIYNVALFNFLTYLVWAPAFLLAGVLSKKIERKFSIIIGSVFKLLFYLWIVTLGEDAANHVAGLAILFGIGSGFYWLSVNTLTVDYTNDRNRDWFNSINGIFASVSQMVGPFIAGWIIELLPGFIGYKMIFGVSVFFFSIAMLFTFFLPNIGKQNTFQWKSIKKIHKDKEWRYLAYIFMCLAFRDGVISFVISLWVYVVTTSEGLLGNFALMTTTLSIITYYLIGRYSKKEQKWKLILWGNALLSLSILVLVIEVNFVTLLIYGIASGICIPMFTVPFNTLSLNSISKFDQKGNLRIEMVVSREMALSVGRITSVGCLALIYATSQNPDEIIPWFLTFLTIVGSSCIIFLRQYKHTL